MTNIFIGNPDLTPAMCEKCGHKITHHINKDEGYRCHSIIYVEKIKDSVQCECRLTQSPNKVLKQRRR